MYNYELVASGEDIFDENLAIIILNLVPKIEK